MERDNFSRSFGTVSGWRVLAVAVLTVIILALSLGKAEALQQVAGPIIFEMQPGQTKTLQWGFVSDLDIPSRLEIRAEGEGADLLSFPGTVTLGPRQFLQIDITVTVPADHRNDVLLEPVITATEINEDEGAIVFNLAMQKTLTIRVGNPVEVEKEPVVQEAPAPAIESRDVIEQVKPSGGMTIEMNEIDEEPQVDPEPQPSQAFVQAQAQTQDDKSGGCLIATAAFGSELAPQVQLLREVRDNVLLSTGSGTSFMGVFNAAYYSFSPTVADWERDSPVFKEVVKTAITPMLSTLSILNVADIDSESEMLGYGIAVILLNIGMYFVAPAFAILTIRKRFV